MPPQERPLPDPRHIARQVYDNPFLTRLTQPEVLDGLTVVFNEYEPKALTQLTDALLTIVGKENKASHKSRRTGALNMLALVPLEKMDPETLKQQYLFALSINGRSSALASNTQELFEAGMILVAYFPATLDAIREIEGVLDSRVSNMPDTPSSSATLKKFNFLKGKLRERIEKQDEDPVREKPGGGGPGKHRASNVILFERPQRPTSRVQAREARGNDVRKARKAAFVREVLEDAQSLPDDQRRILELRFGQRIPRSELARELGTTQGRARRLLADALEATGRDRNSNVNLKF